MGSLVVHPAFARKVRRLPGGARALAVPKRGQGLRWLKLERGDLLVRALRALVRGRPPEALAPRERFFLESMGLLVSPARAALFRRRAAAVPAAAEARRLVGARRAAWKDAAEGLERRGYAVVRGVLSPAQAAKLERHYAFMISEGCLQLGDDLVPLRYVANRDPMALPWLEALARPVAAAAGRAVRPTYSYLVSYRAGASMRRHRDRAACRWSLSLQLGRTPRSSPAWPLYLARRGGGADIAVRLEPGDALFYLGRELEHERRVLGPGRTSTSLLLHYAAVPGAR